MIGPGIYDDHCTRVREETKALAAILIVLEGEDGTGFSVQAPLPVVLLLPQLLRELADKVEAKHKEGEF